MTVSNINVKDKAQYRDSVSIYDSSLSSMSTKQIICQFVKTKCDYLIFEIMNIQNQPNLDDCGFYAIACATELTHGHDPVMCKFDNAAMRSHLISCLEAGYLERFPCKGVRRVPFGSRVRKFTRELIYCICRMPNDDKTNDCMRQL